MTQTKRKYRSISKIRNSTKKVNYISILTSIIMAVLAAVFIVFGIVSKNKVEPIYSYSSIKSSNYEVLLKPNDFYDTETLPPDKYYASKSIDKYIINFIYDFKSSQKANLDYNYSITTEIVGTVLNSENQNKEVWNKTFPLLENNASIYKDNFYINEQINIDYEYYNNLARLYEETYGISIKSTLKVYFNISYNINLRSLREEDKKVNDCIELDIDLTDTITSANKNYNDVTSKDIIQDTNDISNNSIFYILGGIFAAVSAIIIIMLIKQNNKTPEQKYRHNINKILRYYKELIVTVTNKPILEDLKIMEINSLDDLIDVAEQNNSSIIHYEEIKNQRSNLYVIVNNYVYVYIVTYEELR